MALPIKYPGEDIYVSFKKRLADNSYKNLDLCEDIFVYFTNLKRVVKFSKNVKTGYSLLTRVNSTEYAAFLTSENTSYLGKGDIAISFDFIDSIMTSDGRGNKKSTKLIYRACYNPISIER